MWFSLCGCRGSVFFYLPKKKLSVAYLGFSVVLASTRKFTGFSVVTFPRKKSFGGCSLVLCSSSNQSCAGRLFGRVGPARPTENLPRPGRARSIFSASWPGPAWAGAVKMSKGWLFLKRVGGGHEVAVNRKEDIQMNGMASNIST